VIDADPAGHAIAVWAQDDPVSGRELIWASRYEPGDGWGTPERIGEETPVSFLTASTAVGMDDDGNAIAMWSRSTLNGNLLLANRYDSDTGWGDFELIKSDSNTSVSAERLSVGPNGDAIAIWTEGDGVRDDIYAARWSAGVWEEPQRIDEYDAGNKATPDVAVDGSGVAHAVWSQADPDFQNIWSRQYTPGTGWGTPALIEPPLEDREDDADARSPRVQANSVGNTFVVWTQNWRSWSSVWSNRLDPRTGWMTAERIETLERPARQPQIVADENRHAHAVWLHSLSTGIDWVRTTRFE
jgi:hypothetical protein